MPEQIAVASLVIAAGLAGVALGAAGHCVAHMAPMAFDRLDYQRADSLVRRVLKGALPLVAMVSGAAALLAFAGGSWGGGIMLLLASGGIMIARYALNPLPKRPRTPGARRRNSRARIAALRVVAMLMVLFPAALMSLAFGF